MDENESVKFIIDKSKSLLLDKYSVKAWLIVGKTLFSKNFDITYELYLIEKANDNHPEIVKLLHNLYLNFSNEKVFIEELKTITSSLLNIDTNAEIIKYQKIFSSLPNNMQCQLLMEKVEINNRDVVEQCKFLKLLLQKHQDYVPAMLQLANIININLINEKKSDFSTLSNGKCHYLVCDILPLLLKSPQLFTIKEIDFVNLLKLVIEYFLHRIFLHLDHDESIWNTFLSIIKLFGIQLRWGINEALERAKSKEDRLVCLEDMLSSLSSFERDIFDVAKLQLFYHTFFLFIEALYFHMLDLGYNVITKKQTYFLMEFSSNDFLHFENKVKRLKLATEEPILISSKANFMIIIKCWKILNNRFILHDFENIISVFNSNPLLSSLYHNCEIDMSIYQGLYNEALYAIEGSHCKVFDIKIVLQKAFCLYMLKQYIDSIENIFLCLKSEHIVPGRISDDLMFSLSEKKRILKYVNINSQDLFNFCVRIILAMLKSRIVGLGVPISDTVLGHMIVLLQYDWPINVHLFEEIFSIIKQNHTFCYPIFVDYIINVEIIEEFAFIRNSNSLKLELCCTGTKNQNCRSMARLLNKLGTKENLKLVLEKQITRADEEVCDLIKDFLINEQDNIKKCCEK